MADIPHPHGARPRPLSPHLQIYKWSVTMATSITHRITGGALYIGLVFIAWWLVAASMGPETYEPFLTAAANPIGQIILFGFTWAAAYHLFAGIRHLAWDLGYGFLPKDAMWSGIVVIALSIIAAVGMFVWAYSVRMGSADMRSQTPLQRVQGLGAAHSGTQHFWRERITAVALIPLTIWFGFAALALVGAREVDVLTFFQHPWNAGLMGLFIITLLVHSVIGMQSVIDDYVQQPGLKVLALLLNRGFAWLMGAICLVSLLRIVS